MLHPAYLLLGSNIQPVENIQAAVACLQSFFELPAISPIWETPAIGASGPNFLNLVVEITTDLEPDTLKYQVLRQIESQLGRVRQANKNAPRTIDIDILIYDRVILETNLWMQAHIACPLAGLLPDLVNPQTGLPLSQIAEELRNRAPAQLRSDIQIALKPPA
jgi:2-amino-4-hydroxy-6-hydroxymethyldihydropteridine diphosphokinase